MKTIASTALITSLGVALLTSCASPKAANDDQPQSQPAATRSGPSYPEACRIWVDEDGDGQHDEYTRQILDEDGNVLHELEDRDADGVFDYASLRVIGPEGQRWAAHNDQSADGVLDKRYGERPPRDEQMHWLLRPRMVALAYGDEITDAEGRTIGHRKELRRGRGHAVSVRLFDDQKRFVSEWRFVAKSNGPELEPDKLRERIYFDEAARRWKVRPGVGDVERVHLLVRGDGERVLQEALWDKPTEDGVPPIEAIVDGVGLDQPHTVHLTGGVQSPFAPLPDGWEDHLAGLIVREVDQQGRLTLFKKYWEGNFLDAEGSGLGLSLYQAYEYDEHGNIVRTISDGTDRIPNSMRSDGIVDYVERARVEGGHIVEQTKYFAGFDPELSRTRIPDRWLTVPIARPAGATADVEPTMVLAETKTYRRDTGGNELERREQRVLGVRTHRYDERGRPVEIATNGHLDNSRSGRGRLSGFAEKKKSFDYGANKRLVEMREDFHFGQNDREQEKTLYFYDERGRLEQQEHQEWSKRGKREEGPRPYGLSKYVYDERGLVVEKRFDHARYDHADHTVRYTYTADGHLQQKVRKGTESNDKPTTTRHQYDGDKRIETQILKWGAKEPTWRVEYEYGEDGRRAKSRHYRRRRSAEPDEPMELSHTILYDYDAAGRLVREVAWRPPKVTKSSYDCWK